MFRPITESIWHDTEHLRLPGGVIFHARCTVVRLQSGGLWVHSPIPFDDARAAQLEALGPIEHIVSPNGFHHLFAEAAKQRWPQATWWASRALESHVQPDAWLGDDEGSPWPELAVMAIEGAPKMHEFTFLHRDSRTLVVTDLVFHIRYETNAMTRMVLRMAGVHGGRVAQSRLWRVLVKDRAACEASVRALLAEDFDRVILAHGDPIETRGRERLEEALWWMLRGNRPATRAAA
jgi:hypothetical protein